jgi:hydrogenase maturation protease
MTIDSFPQYHHQDQKILVIGYGNELLGDDAVGPYIAKIVSTWDAANVSVIAVPQLTTELAAKIAEANCVIFIDAAHEPLDGIRIKPLQGETLLPSAGASCTLSHASTPTTLLALSQILYGTHPLAWMIEIPATSFQLGQEFSPQAKSGLQAALVEIERILRQGKLSQLRQATEAA